MLCNQDFNVDFSSHNWSVRSAEIKYVILHYTELSFDEALTKLTQDAGPYSVSAHFLIRKDGEVFKLVDEENAAWHAGISYWRGETGINQSSIGIEIDNSGKEKFTDEQIDSCLKLCAYLKEKYSIETANFLGHSDIAPDRKIDPGCYFPWQLFAKKGFGVWPVREEFQEIKVLYKFGDEGEGIAALQNQLKDVGYQIEITQKFDEQTNYVVRAFYSKFCVSEIHHLGVDYDGFVENAYQHEWSEWAQSMLDDLVGQTKDT